MVAGGSKTEVNKEGIAYYNNLIDGLLKKGAWNFCMLCDCYSVPWCIVKSAKLIKNWCFILL